MYDRLGIQGACSLLGGLACVPYPLLALSPCSPADLLLPVRSILFVPVPWVLIKYGKRIRGWSKNALVLD